MEVIHQYHQVLKPHPIKAAEVYTLLELAGRTAYKSEDHITEDSAEKFLASIIARGHESVLEHFSITVKFVTDRGVTHELVRHRLCAFTQESTRYCDYSKKGVVFIRPVFWKADKEDGSKWDLWQMHMSNCEIAYNQLIELGCSPQEARSVLPNSLKTEIVVTANIREWRHILKLRTAEGAHPQMRALMIPVLREFKSTLSVLFGDINVDAM